MKIRRALVSVSDKSGLEEFVRALAEHGVALISTGGTAAAIRDMGLEVTEVADVTGQKEILGGRVKTLHPAVHGGILARPDNASDDAELAEAGIEPIDMVVVNLYPFEEWAGKRGTTEAEVIEHIDIGGPAMIRAAAKNHARVAVVTDPAQYADIQREMAAAKGSVGDSTLRRLATEAYQRTARYDAAIAAWMGALESDFPDGMMVDCDKQFDLRYGENPHQRAAYYVERGSRTDLLARVEQLHGKEMSFNNLLDLDSARNLLGEFELPACVVIKHNNPCGVAVASDIGTAHQRARACDPVSAYGGVIAVNRPVTLSLAEELANTFVEVLIAPEYEAGALDALTRKPNTRVLHNQERRRTGPGELDLRRVRGGFLVQDRDSETEERDMMECVTDTSPDEKQWGDLVFAWRVAKHVKSNAIVLARDLATVGIGAGQMSRVDSVRLSVEKSEVGVEGAVLASDAFFPFADGPDAAIAAGVKAIIQPGGSMRDDEVIASCQERGIPMVFTHRRHFRH